MKQVFHFALFIIGMSVASLSLSAAPLSSSVTHSTTNGFYPPFPPAEQTLTVGHSMTPGFYPPFPPAEQVFGVRGTATTGFYPPFPPK